LVRRIKEADIVSTIGNLARTHDFVLIDLEGIASQMLSRAISRSHLVLIPLNPSPIDAKCAANAVNLVYQESEVLQRTIPYRLLYSRFQETVQSGTFRRIAKAISTNNFPILPTGLVERRAFRDIFEFSKTLEELSSDPMTAKERDQLEKAQENASDLTFSIVEALKTVRQEKAA
jgi:chromosome partitioning protein